MVLMILLLCRYIIPLCYEASQPFPPPVEAEDLGVRDYYCMDLASVVTAMALEVRPGHKVADFCAAPGENTPPVSQLPPLTVAAIAKHMDSD